MMKAQNVNKKWVIIISSVIIFIALMLVLLFFLQTSQDSHEITSNKLKSLPADVETINISGSIVGYDVQELMERSTLVAYGTIEQIDSAKQINGVTGGGFVVTDVTFKTKNILRGDEKDSVIVRFLGGLYDGVYEDYAETPELKLNEEYLMFLYQPGMGGGMNTEGDYYYTTGLYQGVFNRIEAKENQRQLAKFSEISSESDIIFANASVVNDSEKLTQSTYRLFSADSFQKNMETNPTEMIFSLKSLQNSFSSFNAQYPIQYNLFREETEDAYRTNLKNEFITEEEYERLMAALDQYATIGEEEIDPAEESRLAAEKQEALEITEEYKETFQ